RSMPRRARRQGAAGMSAVPTAQDTAIGRPTARIDGPAKVCGRARYTADHQFPGMVYAVPVPATVARGRVLRVHVAAAAAMPGVLRVYTHENIQRLYRVAKASGATLDE